MLFLALPTIVFKALMVGCLLFLIFVYRLMFRRIKAGQTKGIMALVGLGIAPVILFVLLIAFF